MNEKVTKRQDWIDKACLELTGVTSDYQEEWQARRYHIGGKMFLMWGVDNKSRPIATIKLDPLFGEMLRREHDDIVPGYHMNKTHWNSVYLEGDINDDLYKTMIEQAYDIVFKSLTKKLQKEILDD